MLNFVAKAFRTWMNIVLFMMLAGSAIGGAVVLGIMGFGFDAGRAVLGFLGGGLAGLIMVILTGGLVANFLNMVDNVEAIRKKLERTGTGTTGEETEAAGS